VSAPEDDDAAGTGPSDASTDTYVHDPDGVTEGGPTQPRNRRPDGPPPDGDFDWRGWVLVGAIVFAFLVAPGVLYLLPSARGFVSGLGLGLRNTYLVLPLLPALGLGAIAVWAAVRSRARR
jgi:hypothetical protein